MAHLPSLCGCLCHCLCVLGHCSVLACGMVSPLWSFFLRFRLHTPLSGSLREILAAHWNHQRAPTLLLLDECGCMANWNVWSLSPCHVFCFIRRDCRREALCLWLACTHQELAQSRRSYFTICNPCFTRHFAGGDGCHWPRDLEKQLPIVECYACNRLHSCGPVLGCLDYWGSDSENRSLCGCLSRKSAESVLLRHSHKSAANSRHWEWTPWDGSSAWLGASKHFCFWGDHPWRCEQTVSATKSDDSPSLQHI